MAINISQGFGDADYSSFCQKVTTKFSVHLRDYKPEQMKRRLAMLAEQVGCQSFTSYFTLIQTDPLQLGVFMDQVTINVTELVRNPNIWETLMQEVYPCIPSNPQNTFNVWSAGCSYGAEAYTLAMLLHEKNAGRPYKIKGTDLDLTILSRANTAHFSEADMANVSLERRKAYFTCIDEKNFIPSMKLRMNISFSRHDLLADPYPAQQYDLIVCRNVLIYFTDPAKDKIYEGFMNALKPGGVLFVGGTERINEHRRFGFENLRPFFYQKPLSIKKAA